MQGVRGTMELVFGKNAEKTHLQYGLDPQAWGIGNSVCNFLIYSGQAGSGRSGLSTHASNAEAKPSLPKFRCSLMSDFSRCPA
jgi:hypothetical protein